MKLQAALKKINNRAKKVGKEVVIRHSDYKTYVRFEGAEYTMSFHTRNGEEDYCHLWHVVRDGDESDPYTDYFAGSHLSNLTQALNWVAPLPPKFKAGDLVRFKDSKRTRRIRVAGKVGLVMKNAKGGNPYYSIMGKDISDRMTYSQRDLELAV